MTTSVYIPAYTLESHWGSAVWLLGRRYPGLLKPGDFPRMKPLSSQALKIWKEQRTRSGLL